MFTDGFREDLGGGTRVAIDLVKGLMDKGNDVLVVTGKNANVEGCKILTLPSIPYPFYRNAEMVFPNIDVIRGLKDFNPDIIHYHEPFLAGLIAVLSSRILRKKVIGTIHIEPKQLSKHSVKIDNGNLAKKLVGFFAQYSNGMAFVSKYQFGLYERYINGLPSKVIYNGIPDEFFVSSHRRLRKHRNRVLTVSRLDTDKNLRFALKVMRLVSSQKPDVSYTVVGEGRQRKSLENLARKINLNVSFLGRIERAKLTKVYLKSDVFFLPSKTETFGLVFAEAMATGLPVVAVNEGAAPEVVSNGGIVCDARLKSVSRALLSMLSDDELYERKSSLATTISEKFRLSHFIGNYEKFYREVINA